MKQKIKRNAIGQKSQTRNERESFNVYTRYYKDELSFQRMRGTFEVYAGLCFRSSHPDRVVSLNKIELRAIDLLNYLPDWPVIYPTDFTLFIL